MSVEKETLEQAAYEFVQKAMEGISVQKRPDMLETFLRIAYMAGYEQATFDDPYFKESVNDSVAVEAKK